MRRLEGKVALVTGAGRGLGRAIAVTFAREGAKVAVLSRSRETIDVTVENITAGGGVAVGIQFDITDLDRIDSIVKHTADTFGTLDILVNNAYDFSPGWRRPVLETTTEDMRRAFDLGPISNLRFMQACFPYMDGRDGRIINLASCVGVISHSGYVAYSATKEAIRAVTRTAAREWGDRRVTVNSIAPVSDTDSYRDEIAYRNGAAPHPPIPRIGDPEKDLAPIALFLAGADAGYVTGYTFFGDGGLTMDAGR